MRARLILSVMAVLLWAAAVQTAPAASAANPAGTANPANLAGTANTANPAGTANTDYHQVYSNLHGEVVLDNERVLVQKFDIAPGQATGHHPRRVQPLLVFIKGGALTSQATGRTTLWKEGRVAWESNTDALEAGSTNTGGTPIEFVTVTLKPAPPKRAGAAPQYRYLHYPNIPGEDLLEDERVIVQRFVIQPGQWEGVHAHHPNMLYIHVKGGSWAVRSKTQPPTPYPQPAPDGLVGWEPTIDISEGHQSGNVGKTPIDLIWVTLKQ